MTGPDDAPFEMTSSDEIDDAYAERLLRTRGLASGSRHDSAAQFIAAVADLGNIAPTPTAALARLLQEGFVPAPAPIPAAVPRVAPARSGWRTSRTLLAGVLAGSALVGLSSAATAGVLPGVLQDRIGGLLEATTPFEFPLLDEPSAPVQDKPAPAPKDKRPPVPPAPVAPNPGVPAGVATPSPLLPPPPAVVGEPDMVGPTAPQQPPAPGSPPAFAPGSEVAPPRDNPGPPAPPAPPADGRPVPGPPQEIPPGAGPRGAAQQGGGTESPARAQSSGVSR